MRKRVDVGPVGHSQDNELGAVIFGYLQDFVCRFAHLGYEFRLN